MDKSLFSLMAEAAQKEKILLEHGGDLDSPEVQAVLAVTEINVPAKIDGYKFQIDRFRAIAESLAAQEKMIAVIRKRMAEAASRLEDNLLHIMEMHGLSTIDGVHFEARIKQNPESVEITDEAKIPAEFFTVTMLREPSKVAIKDALKKGRELEGARLVRRRKIEMRPATKKIGEAV